MKPTLIFEDNHLLVVAKPPGMLSQADRTGDMDILTYLKHDLARRYNKPGNVFLGLVHRLDRPVGGVMVFAKTSKAAARLSNQVRDRVFQKSYLAVVHGRPPQTAQLRDFLRKESGANMVAVVGENAKGAKEALLSYQLMQKADGLSLLKVAPITGRSHQIRVQLSAHGYPLYGDQRYGAEVNRPGQQIALFCQELSFFHPTLKSPLVFSLNPGKEYPWNLFSGYEI